MCSKTLLRSLLFLFFHFTNFSTQSLFAENDQGVDAHDLYVQALASLVFHTQEWQQTLISREPPCDDQVTFTIEEVTGLWEKVYDTIYHTHNPEQIQRASRLETAYQFYDKTIHLIDLGLEEEAIATLSTSSKELHLLWEEALELEEKMTIPSTDFSQILRAKRDPNIEHNRHITSSTEKKMRPYLLPLYHPMRRLLDHLCLKTRVTADEDSFHQAGFITIVTRPRSYIRVAKHSKMPGYLVKVYLDTVLKEKYHKPSWKWLVLRCEGAEKIRNIIRYRQINNFVVANKWIYCLPPKPSPPQSSQYMRHLALLLVTDMNLVPKKQNIDAWKSKITKKHLEELHTIISRAKGSSYRADNIAYTKQGQFAFIDTEYPSKGPDFNSIRHYLNPKMRDYWDQLVKNGGL
jgi:hypothetical protein